MSQASEQVFLKTCLAQLIEFVRSSNDEKIHVIMILADLRNALDNLNQELFLKKEIFLVFRHI